MLTRTAVALGLVGTLLAASPWAAPQQAWIAGAKGVFIRSGPRTESAALGVLREGHRLRVLNSRDSWWQVETEEGTTGFVHEKFLAIRPLTSQQEAVVPATAQTPDPTPERQGTDRPLAEEITALREQIRTLNRESRRLADLLASSSQQNPGAEPTALEGVLGLPHPLGQGVAVLIAALCGWILGSFFQRRRARRDRYRLRL